MSAPENSYASFEEIAACQDVDTLNQWIAEARFLAADIKAQLEAERELGTADEDWEDRATSAFVSAKRTVAKCQTRLRMIGFYDPPELEKRGLEIARLNKLVAAQRRALARLEAKVAELTATEQVAS